jgi:hypothetical protein
MVRDTCRITDQIGTTLKAPIHVTRQPSRQLPARMDDRQNLGPFPHTYFVSRYGAYIMVWCLPNSEYSYVRLCAKYLELSFLTPGT